MAKLKLISDALIEGNVRKVKELVQKALEDNVEATEVVDEGLIPGMEVIGKLFKNEELYIPDVLMSAKAMQAGMELLRPLLAKSGVQPKGVFVIGTVYGDLHNIGKNLVTIMLEGAGWKVIDLGVNVAAEKFLQASKDEAADIIGISCLLTTTMKSMRNVVQFLKNNNCKAKIIVGGPPLSQSFSDEIGADAFANDGGTGVEIANRFV
jgi:5-methyltetrahydrofolate--homocysteine methyltransferase